MIDFTPFLLRDAHGVAQRLKSSGQGSYKLDVGKSALAMNRTKSFPENSEFEAMLTFEGEPTGNYIRSVSPNPNLVTVVQHHSFIKLPDLQYTPRVFDLEVARFLYRIWIMPHQLLSQLPNNLLHDIGLRKTP